jgi:hypothetical protein
MKSQGFSIRLNGIIGFVFLVLIFVVLFFVAKGLFNILSWVAPALIIGALLINYRTVLNYLKFMAGLLHRNALGGILAILLSIIGFPILSGVLFGKAILDRKVRKLQAAHQSRQDAEYVEYEEVIRPDREEKLDLPPLEKEAPPKKDNRYEDLF